MTVSDLLSGSIIGSLANISGGGFMLVTDQDLPLNALYQLRLHLPDNLSGGRDLNLGAESLWCNPGENTGSRCQWYGFHIIDISNEDAELIEQLSQSWSS
ncbi:MAG: hypothetical protein B0D85_01620 [Candidatus Sedimenticola endophacoides]|nr:MAG: hypothetical protein B0D85_01620 [Candidatus Sedimenticola endophacoides]